MKRKEFLALIDRTDRLTREERIELISELNIRTYGYAETLLMENILFRYNRPEYWDADLMNVLTNREKGEK